MTIEPQAVDSKTLWHEHCRNAVRKFVMHAVVIDNQPVLDNADVSGHGAAKTATYVDEGMGEVPQVVEVTAGENREIVELAVEGRTIANEKTSTAEGEVIEEETADAENTRVHNLNVREISDAFAEQEIACAFVLPFDEDKDEAKIFSRIMAASIPADIVVIDWYLRDKKPKFTKRVLAAIAEKDAGEKGRLRLICVYTGQTDTEAVTKDSVAALLAGGLKSDKIDEEAGCAYGNHHCLLVLNKQDVHGAALPLRILEALTELSDGILPAFALAAVAAVRRNVHHIITRFSSDLDAAYVANRLITDPPTEVAELIRELFISECDNALGLEQVADHFLSEDQIKYWFANLDQPISAPNFKAEIEKVTAGGKTVKEGRTVNIDIKFLHSLLTDGITDGSVITEHGPIDFPESLRGKVSAALHRKEDNPDGERRFARFAVLKREAFGNTKLTSDEKWTPSLTLGTLLSQQIELPAGGGGEEAKTLMKYYYCLTPSCDTIRIKGSERNFLMLELEEGKGNTNLVVLEKEGRQKKLFINPKPIRIQTFNFKGNEETGRVQATIIEEAGLSNPMFLFNTTGDPSIEFLWLGEVRRNRANRDMAELNRNWLRLGIKDSEYLRLAGKGDVKI